MTALSDLSKLLNRYDSSPEPVKFDLRKRLSPTIAAADAEFDAIGERLSTRRDWIEQHRADDPPHPQYEKRRAHFFSVDVKAHAEAGELLERAFAALSQPERSAA